jgi:hypothetical protein
LPHSGISGSKRARRSPEHFAVRRALHRLLAPRHPPAALCSLIISKRLGASPQKLDVAVSDAVLGVSRAAAWLTPVRSREDL